MSQVMNLHDLFATLLFYSYPILVYIAERFMDRLKKHHPETEKQQEEFSKFNKYVCQKLQDNSRGAVKSEKDQTQ